MTHPPPVVLIGLDGAEPSLIQAWAASGMLPTLGALVAQGTWRNLQALPGMGDGAHWPSLITGVNPGRHGRYFRRQTRPGTYQVTNFDVDRDLQWRPFWETLGSSGDRVAILDMPYAPRAKDLNGLLLTDWYIHDRYGSVRSWPPEFAQRVLDKFGDDPFDGDTDRLPMTGSSLCWLLEQSLARVARKAQLVADTMRQQRWDVVATCFAEPHDVGHRMWHLHDRFHPSHDPEWRREHGDPLLILYREIDSAVRKILDTAPVEATVIVTAGLGMGPNYTANRVLEEILSRLDSRPVVPSLRRKLVAARAPSLAVRLAARVDVHRRTRALERSRFFAVPHNENSGAIRINLRGREPEGIVPVEQFKSTFEELARELRQLVNPRTRQSIVSDIVRVSDHYHGDNISALPDMFVVWNRQAPFDAVCSPTIGRIEGARSWGRTGDHTPHAVAVIRGGRGATIQLKENMSVLDVAPTIGALRGRPLDGLDGVSALTNSPFGAPS